MGLHGFDVVRAHLRSRAARFLSAVALAGLLLPGAVACGGAAEPGGGAGVDVDAGAPGGSTDAVGGGTWDGGGGSRGDVAARSDVAGLRDASAPPDAGPAIDVPATPDVGTPPRDILPPPEDVPVLEFGTVRGTVWAPGNAPGMAPAGQEIPVYGAFVVLTHTLPAPFPERAYCQECVWPSGRGALSEEDGHFEIAHVPADTYFLIVQKGQFRRMEQVVVPPNGVVELPAEKTTLPSAHDPTRGWWIPKIALAVGSYDALEDVLGKMRMGRVDGAGLFDMSSSQGIFDIWANGGEDGGVALGNFADLVSDLQRMLQYHIIFIPCSSDMSTNALRDQGVLRNLRDYVKSGGRLYVTDWSGEWFDAVFPSPVDLGPVDTPASAYDPATDTWKTWEFGSADGGFYDSENAQAVDEHLNAWLEGQSGPTPWSATAVAYDPDEFYIEGNWNVIEALTPLEVGTDPNGAPIMNEPHAYVVGGTASNPLPKRPMTVTFEPAGCGRVLFSTYHTTDETHVGLMPQERVLIYLIMEIGVCHDPKLDYL